MINKNVIITIRGTQSNNDGEPTNLELVTEGRYYKKKDGFEVIYKETEITGMEGTTTSVRVYPDRVVLNRTGSVNSQLIFEKGHKHVSYYETLGGAFSIGVFTNSVLVNNNNEGIEIKVDYFLDVDNAKTGENDFYMVVRNC